MRLGIHPLPPPVYPQFLDESVPKERENGMEMAKDRLRRYRFIMVCGDTVTDDMMEEIMLAWCNKVNGKARGATNEVPSERVKKEGLTPLSRECIIDKINLGRVEKDCLISYANSVVQPPSK